MNEIFNISLVRQELEKQKKTQAELADFLGITKKTVVTIFKTGICRIDQIQKMAEFLDTGISNFIVEHGETLKTKLDQINQLQETLRATRDSGMWIEEMADTQKRYINYLEEHLMKYEPDNPNFKRRKK